jgi:hypothetical protein
LADNTDNTNEVRSINEALGDLVEKHDRLPRSHPDRQPWSG